MASGTMVSRVLGFIRTALLAVAIGASTTMADIFEKANVIPTIIFMLLAGGIFNVVLVPQLIKASKASDRGSAYTSKLVTLTIVVMGLATVLLTSMAGPLIKALTLDWTAPMLAMGTAFAYWCLPQVFFYGVYAVIGQVLNAHGRFTAYMWAPVANNVVQIFTIGTFIVLFGAYGGGTDQLETWTDSQTVLLAGGCHAGHCGPGRCPVLAAAQARAEPAPGPRLARHGPAPRGQDCRLDLGLHDGRQHRLAGELQVRLLGIRGS